MSLKRILRIIAVEYNRCVIMQMLWHFIIYKLTDSHLLNKFTSHRNSLFVIYLFVLSFFVCTRLLQSG